MWVPKCVVKLQLIENLALQWDIILCFYLLCIRQSESWELMTCRSAISVESDGSRVHLWTVRLIADMLSYQPYEALCREWFADFGAE